jgi:signal peptidase II
MKRPRPLFFGVVALVLTLDQASKFWIASRHIPGWSTEVIPGLFNLVYVPNEGIAFGHFNGHDANLLLAWIALGILAGGFWYARRFDWTTVSVNLPAALITGGAIGNVIDRFRVGHVIDFIDLHIRDHHWPAFNIADACISLTVIWLLWKSWTVRPPARGRTVDAGTGGT